MAQPLINYHDQFIFSELDLQILRLLIQHEKGLIRDDLVNYLEKPRTTIFDHLDKLKRYKLLMDWQHIHGRGRPYTIFSLTTIGKAFYAECQRDGLL